MNTKAVVLLSGGLDSAVMAADAARSGYTLHAMTFQYGQRHAVEVAAAHRVAAHLGIADHRVVQVDLRAFGGSALTSDAPVQKHEECATPNPTTYVPARNTIFLSFALAWAEVLGAANIFIGVNADDYTGYPDCRREYINAYRSMALLATRGTASGEESLTIHTPLSGMSKAQIIRLGAECGLDFGMTSSCYDPCQDGAACGGCAACLIRLRGFSENNMRDTVAYGQGLHR